MSFAAKSLALTAQILEEILPEIDWLLEHMEENGGWLGFNSDFIENLIAWKIPIWSTFYLDERKLKNLGMLCLYDIEELKSVTPENAAEFNEKAKQDVLDVLGELDFSSLPSQEEIKSYIDQAEDSEQHEFTKQTLYWIYSFLTSTFNYLSLMTFGRTICQLITHAQEQGVEADKCLCQAIQIDRTILQLPFVQDRILKA